MSTHDRNPEGGVHDIPQDGGEDGASPTVVLQTTLLGDVRVETLEFLCPYLIAKGKLTLIAGEPGLGKSMAVLSLAAIASSGDPWPGTSERHEPIEVLVYNVEDGVNDTTAPRLIAAGADLQRVHILERVTRPHASVVDLQRDLAVFEEFLRAHPAVKLLTLDPLQALMGRCVDTHRNASVRAVLDPLAQLADRYGVAVLAIDHLNKAEGLSPINRLTGSIAFAAAARVVVAIVRDRSDPDRRVVAPIKINVAKHGYGFAFRIGDAHVQDAGLVPRVEWEAERIEITAAEVMQVDPRARPKGPSRVEIAAKWLEHRLRTVGPETKAVLEREAALEGISTDALRKARESLGIDSGPGGFGGKWVWRFPSDVVSREDAQDWGNEASEGSKSDEIVEESSMSSVLSSDAAEDAAETLNTDKTGADPTDGGAGEMSAAATASVQSAHAPGDPVVAQSEGGVESRSEERSSALAETVHLATAEIASEDGANGVVDRVDNAAETTPRDETPQAPPKIRAKRKKRRRSNRGGRGRQANPIATASVVGAQNGQCCATSKTEESPEISSVSPVLRIPQERRSPEACSTRAKRKPQRVPAARAKKAKHARGTRGRGASRGKRELEATEAPASNGGVA